MKFRFVVARSRFGVKTSFCFDFSKSDKSLSKKVRYDIFKMKMSHFARILKLKSTESDLVGSMATVNINKLNM